MFITLLMIDGIEERERERDVSSEGKRVGICRF